MIIIITIIVIMSIMSIVFGYYWLKVRNNNTDTTSVQPTPTVDETSVQPTPTVDETTYETSDPPVVVPQTADYIYETGEITFSRQDFLDAGESNASKITKNVVFNDSIPNARILKGITYSDCRSAYKFELIVAEVTDSGFKISLHGTPGQLASYWGVKISWLSHNSPHIQSGHSSFTNIGKARYKKKPYPKGYEDALEKKIDIKFNRPFNSTPDVLLFVSGYSVNSPTFTFWKNNITKNGFEVQLNKWNRNDASFVTFDYIAVEKNDPDIKLDSWSKGCWPKTTNCTLVNNYRSRIGTSGWAESATHKWKPNRAAPMKMFGVMGYDMGGTGFDQGPEVHGYLAGWKSPIVYYDTFDKARVQIQKLVNEGKFTSGGITKGEKGYDVRQTTDLNPKVGEKDWNEKSWVITKRVDPVIRFDIKLDGVEGTYRTWRESETYAMYIGRIEVVNHD